MAPLPSPCPIVSTAEAGNALLTPGFSVPAETWVYAQLLPAEAMVQVPASVLLTVALGIVSVPLIVPEPPPRTNRVPVNPPPPAPTLPLIVRVPAFAVA